jgi:hypothetical protein
VLFRATGARITVRNFLPSVTGSFSVNASGPATIEVFPPDGGRPVRRNVPAGRTRIRL